MTNELAVVDIKEKGSSHENTCVLSLGVEKFFGLGKLLLSVITYYIQKESLFNNIYYIEY